MAAFGEKAFMLLKVENVDHGAFGLAGGKPGFPDNRHPAGSGFTPGAVPSHYDPGNGKGIGLICNVKSRWYLCRKTWPMHDALWNQPGL